MQYHLLNPGNCLKIMKITFSQLLIALILSSVAYSKSTNAQILDKIVNVTIQQPNLEGALKVIEKSAGVKFVYSKSIIKTDKQVTYTGTAQRLDVILNSILPNEITYQLINDRIVLSNKKAVDSNPQPVRQAATQQVPVKGKVVSDKGEELIGVSITVKGTTTGTVTDVNGNFTLPNVEANTVLVVKYVGFATQEVTVGSQTNLTITLVTQSSSLNEVVVVGYGTRKKSDVTGAVASVSAEQIQQVPVQNITQALQGRAAGVDVVGGNFRPGQTPAITIRGNRSVRASNEPLYVVDGIPLAEGTGLSDFNQNDVQSIEVLKDASSTAIYGSRGANGVILVTTKRGKEGRYTIGYDTYTSFESMLPKLDLLNGGEYAELRRQASISQGAYSRASGGTNFYFPDPESDFQFYRNDLNAWEGVAQAYEWVDKANRIPQMRPITEQERATYTAYYNDLRAKYPTATNLLDPATITQVPVYDASKVRTTDWIDQVLRTGVSQSHQLNASGGTEKLKLAFSGGYLNTIGIQKGQDYSRYNARISFDLKINDHISLGGSTNGSISIINNGANLFGRAAGQLPIAVPYDANGNFITLPGGDSGILNPVRDDQYVFGENRISRLFGSFFADIKILPGLRYHVNFGPDQRNTRNGNFTSSLAAEAQGSTSSAGRTDGQNFTYVVENLLYYDKQFGKDHTLGLTALQAMQKDRAESVTLSANNLPFDSQRWYNLGSTYNSGPSSFASTFSTRTILSYMGRANYAYKNKYLLTATGRWDGSSVLATGNQWSFFPSVSVAWKLQEESFIKNKPWIDELKIRAGYGSVGQQGINPYLTRGTLGRTTYVWDEIAAYGYAPATYALPNLGWETTSTINVGVDFSLFKGFLNGSVEVYRAKTTDLILPDQLPITGGIGEVIANIGATQNQGIEIGLTTNNIRGKNWKWSTDFVFTQNREEIKELTNGLQSDIGNLRFVGQPLGAYYDYQFAGIWQNTPEDLAELAKFKAKSPSSKAFQPGKLRVTDVNGDYLINGDDRVVLGSNRPDWSGSINNRITYKSFDLSFLVYARVGQKINSIAYRPGLSGRYTGVDFNYWTPVNPSNEFPQPDRSADIQEFGSALQYQSGSFVKVRNISLSYALPKSLISKVGLSGLSFYVNSTNPFLFTSFKSLDPEATDPGTGSGDTNISRGLSQKSLVFGLRANL